MDNVTIKPAVRGDIPKVLEMILDLADYENLRNEVAATEELLAKWLFDTPRAEVILAETGGEAVGYALFFHNFSTFLGRAGIYIEDLYVKRERRGKGLGKAMLKYIAELALSRDCGRVELACLDWNEPSIEFYRSLGGIPMNGWTTYRFSGDAINKLGSL